MSRAAVAATRLALNEAVFEWCVRNVRRRLDQGELEPALAWSVLAARSAVHHGFGRLALPALEGALLEAATRLPVPAEPGARSGPTRWLHVMDRAATLGGHSALVERWASLDRSGDRHRALLLAQREPIPPRLAAAMAATGGDVTALALETPLADRALRLREEAWRSADRVVLHVHPWSVLPVVAFGVAGGPPVALLNHLSQHVWVGGSVADVVLSLRASAVEWSRAHRGIARNALLPISLPPVRERPDRAEARRMLGLPAEACVLLTVGHHYKYRPLPGLDFLEAAATILRARPHVQLLAVGPNEDARWRDLRAATGGRARALGPRHDLPRIHAAVDVYLEGFPVGSPTALLEAGLRGLACVRAPADVPPPFAIDGPALDALAQPTDLDAHAKATLALVDDPARRAAMGRALAHAIEAHHAGAGWLGHLDRARASLPPRHGLHPSAAVAPLPAAIRDFSVALATLHHEDDTLTFTLRAALAHGLHPRLDARLLRALAGVCLPRDPRLFLRRPLLSAVAGSIVGAGLVARVRRARGGGPPDRAA